eukprot:snap_masked-scaffold_134-processed-gene-0.0-mRNA-1 protein AED:1.00 eAED:1.00 QI:0/0/0/0/1/1/2/0/128
MVYSIGRWRWLDSSVWFRGILLFRWGLSKFVDIPGENGGLDQFFLAYLEQWEKIVAGFQFSEEYVENGRSGRTSTLQELTNKIYPSKSVSSIVLDDIIIMQLNNTELKTISEYDLNIIRVQESMSKIS